MRLGKVLADWRWMNRLSQAVAAERIGIPTSTLGHLENGGDVTGRNLAAVLVCLTGEEDEAGEAPRQLALEGPRKAAE